LSIDAAFLVHLDDQDLTAAVAHELGHVWIYTHHPFLHTEALANEIAMRVVSRDSLRRLYEKLWAFDGAHGNSDEAARTHLDNARSASQSFIGIAIAVVIDAVADHLDRAWVHELRLGAARSGLVAAVAFAHEPAIAVAIGRLRVARRAFSGDALVGALADEAALAAVFLIVLRVDARRRRDPDAARRATLAART
jgi:hypothetical protein